MSSLEMTSRSGTRSFGSVEAHVVHHYQLISGFIFGGLERSSRVKCHTQGKKYKHIDGSSMLGCLTYFMIGEILMHML